MTYPKRLIEVDLPIKRISAHARREKSIRHGHISTLHIWWARRPLAACRAVICAALWPDPADPECPQAFRDAAAEVLQTFVTEVTSSLALAESCSPQSYGNWQGVLKGGGLSAVRPEHQNLMRHLLLDFIADFSNWDNATKPAYLKAARALTQAAHEALGGEPGTRPLVVDPFAGGGAIPLEALRVGADAFASDLNPVAVLLNKVVLEYIPRYGQQLADEVRKWGQWIKEEAEKELAEFYPKDPDGATPIAYLWARTVRCEGPGCGAEVPLMRSLWLANRPKNGIALKIIPDPVEKRVDFEILRDAKAKDVGDGTVARGSAACPVCGYTTSVASVRRQFKVRSGGAADARLIAVRRPEPEGGERSFRGATDGDLFAIHRAVEVLDEQERTDKSPLSFVPDEPTPLGGGKGAGRAFSQRNYGMDRFRDLFTPRQALSLARFARLVPEVGKMLRSTADPNLADAVQTCLALSLDRLADFNSSLCTLNSTGGRGVLHTFARPALPMIWDFLETNPFNDVGANWDGCINALVETILAHCHGGASATVESASAIDHPLPDEACAAVVTDPPYYDAVPYADLSDFFYVWLRRTLPIVMAAAFSQALTPKEDECILDDAKGKDQAYFRATMCLAMAEARRITVPDGIGVVVFAHKTMAGWDAQLQAMIDGGWTVTGSWPIDTERPGRLRAMGSAALTSSIHLVCRPRPNSHTSTPPNAHTAVGDWRDVLHELPRRIHDWMPRLAHEGVVGADAIFACLGPALEVFSRYDRVEKASGEAVPLREYLEHVWAAVSKEALDMVFHGADTAGFEEDSRLTAMWLWTLAGATSAGESAAGTADGAGGEHEEEEGSSVTSSGYSLEFDAANNIARGIGADLTRMTTVVAVKGSDARMLPVRERSRFLFSSAAAEAERPVARGGKGRNLQMVLPGLGTDDAVDSSPAAVSPRSFTPTDTPPTPGATTLDRVHQSMILFGDGRSEAMRRFLVEDGAGADARFWSLAQALSALYPAGSEEKRWVDGVLARKRGLGF